MAHNYLVTAQPATVVSASHVGYFNSEDELNTILIKGNNIEIYNISSDDGFQKINELPFYGRIIKSLVFRPPKCKTDHLFLLTQSFSFCIISTDPSTNQIITKASGQLKEDNSSIKTSSQSLVTIDQTQQNVLIHIYKGELLLIQLDEYGKLKQHSGAEKIIIHELEILSLTFLYKKDYSSITESKEEQLPINNSSSSIISQSNDSNNNSMNIDNDNNTNDSNATSNDLSQSLISPSTASSTKAKATKVIKSAKAKASQGLSKLKAGKVGEKIANLRKRSRSRDNLAETKDNNDEEEKKSSDKGSVTLNKNKLLLCILYQDYRKGRHIKTYQLNQSLYELEDGPWVTLMVEEGCNKLIAIPPPIYGVLFIGQYSIAYRNNDNCQRVQVPDGDLCCFDLISQKRPKVNIHQDEDDEEEDNDNTMENDENDDTQDVVIANNDNNVNKPVIVDGTRWLIGMLWTICL